MNTEDFIQKSFSRHNGRYEYSNTKYVSPREKVVIVCQEHGPFLQSPIDHLAGNGCRKCQYQLTSDLNSLGREKFIQRAKAVHGDLYDYSKVVYKNKETAVEIICNIHGSFFPRPHNHVAKASICPVCSDKNVRRTSIAEKAWLASLNISDMVYQHTVILNSRRLPFDGYSPSLHTLYEFHGDYWHGNPAVFNSYEFNKKAKKSFGELYRNTIEKEDNARRAGYALVSIW